MLRSVAANSTAAYLSEGTTGQHKGLAGARLTAAAAAATAVIRETDGSGRVLATLAAPVNGADELRPIAPISFSGNVHVTIAGAGAQLNLFEA